MTIDRNEHLRTQPLTYLDLADEVESFSSICGTFVFLNYFYPFASLLSLIPLAQSPGFFLSAACLVSAAYFAISFLIGVTAAGRLPTVYLHFSQPIHLVSIAALPMPALVFEGLGNSNVQGLFWGMLFGYVLMVFVQYARFVIYHSKDVKQILKTDRRWLLSHLNSGTQRESYIKIFLKSLSGAAEFALFVAIFLVPMVVLANYAEEFSETRRSGKALGYLAVLLGSFAVFLLIQFRPTGVRATRGNAKEFHLYLRPFEKSFDRITQTFSRRSNFSFLKKLSAGEFLSRFLTVPIVAAHNTNRFFKEVGPLENSYSHDEWRSKISQDIDGCARVFVCLSDSPSLKEELGLIKDAGKVGNSLFIFSPKLSCEENLETLREAGILAINVGGSILSKSFGIFFSDACGWVLVQGVEESLSDIDLMFLCSAFLKKDTPRFKSIVEKYGKVLP